MIRILSSSFSTTETVAIVATILAGIASVLFLAFRFTAKSLDVAWLEYFMLKQMDRAMLQRSGLKEKSVEIQIPTRLWLGFSSHKTIRAHYLEREAATDLGNGAENRRRDLLIIPGFTAPSTTMSELVWRMRPPPEWRVVVMELPLHDRNVGNFDGEFPDSVGIFEYAAAFAKAVAMGGEGAPPLCLCGYSLGGNVCMRYLHERPAGISKVVLIAPGFAETMDDDFVRIGKENPRLAHAWQTLEELRAFFGPTGLGFPPGHLAHLAPFQRGMHRGREEVYGKHENFFVNYWAALQEEEDTKKGQEESLLRESLLRGIRTPVLLVTGQKDNCISSDKCRTYIRDVIGKERCTFHELPDTGHYGGPSDGWIPNGNIMTGSAPFCAEFLFGD